jgi:hypothetical protein
MARFVELCAGIGGFSLAATWCGWDVVGQVSLPAVSLAIKHDVALRHQFVGKGFQLCVERLVSRSREHQQVLNPVVQAITVDVVDDLAGRKRAAQMILHYRLMLVDVFVGSVSLRSINATVADCIRKLAALPASVISSAHIALLHERLTPTRPTFLNRLMAYPIRTGDGSLAFSRLNASLNSVLVCVGDDRPDHFRLPFVGTIVPKMVPLW